MLFDSVSTATMGCCARARTTRARLSSSATSMGSVNGGAGIGRKSILPRRWLLNWIAIMVWFYAGARGTIRVETLHDAAKNEYVLSIERPEQAVVVERFVDSTEFDTRLRTLEGELED